MKFMLHDYQQFAIDYIESHPIAAFSLTWAWVEGKTAIKLTAINELMYSRFEVHKVLVVAPLRVARNTWPAEIEKWDHLQGITYRIHSSALANFTVPD